MSETKTGGLLAQLDEAEETLKAQRAAHAAERARIQMQDEARVQLVTTLAIKATLLHAAELQAFVKGRMWPNGAWVSVVQIPQDDAPRVFTRTFSPRLYRNGAYVDVPNLYDLAAELGVEVPEDAR